MTTESPPPSGFMLVIERHSIGLTALARGTGRSHKQAGCNWLNVLLGLWLIISPFVLGFSNQLRPLWNSIILGVFVELPALKALSGRSTASPSPLLGLHDCEARDSREPS